MAMSLVQAWVLPHPLLRKHIDRYWISSGPAGMALPSLFPGTGVEVFFHLGRPFVVSPVNGGAQDAPSAHLGYLRSRPLTVRADSDFSFLSVRVRSGGLRHLCPVLPACGIDYPLSVEDVWGRNAADIGYRLMAAPTLNEQAALLDTWLLACLERFARHDPVIDHAVERLYYDHAAIRIEEVSAALGLGRRQLERLFKSAIGCSPKAFQRTARFQHTLRELTLSGGCRYLDVALAHGFYDQAHFIREFESFVGESPSRFFASQRMASHFYNASLRRCT
ncbi:AraC family transcriptional regulator [Paludibacterium yongneupense]|uniref:AraC family transcriptional regulator n=1 Tax=Paludibacterium yongneupense TaxID=400061 RepID=UPI0003FB08A6|nr:helix-turn-helix domain-containing protein [Paludibacterium yongneupense]